MASLTGKNFFFGFLSGIAAGVALHKYWPAIRRGANNLVASGKKLFAG